MLLFRGLSGGDVEAGLMDFVLHVAGAGQSLVFQDFGQDGLVDGDPSDFALSFVGILDFKKTVVGDIERGAVLVAGVEGGVAVSFAKLFDVGLSAENGSDDEFVERIAFGDKRVIEGAGNSVEQCGSTGHEIGDGVVEGLHDVEGVVSDVHQFVDAALGFFAVRDKGDAKLLGTGELYVVEVRKGGLESDNACHAIFYRLTITAKQTERLTLCQ